MPKWESSSVSGKPILTKIGTATKGIATAAVRASKSPSNVKISSTSVHESNDTKTNNSIGKVSLAFLWVIVPPEICSKANIQLSKNF